MAHLEPILSPEEVRNLLDAVNGSASPGISLLAEPVDLLADDRHLRILVPTLRVGFARVAESLRRVLTSVLRGKVEIRDEEPEILSGRGLVSVAERAACLIVLRMSVASGDPAFGILALDPVFAFGLIERLFGGTSGQTVSGGRNPTPLERRMLIRALQPVIDAFNENLEPKGYLELEIHSVESRLDLVPGYTPDITALHVPFTMTVSQDRLASISFAIPAAALEPLRAHLGRSLDANNQGLALGMPAVGISLTVELGRISLTLREILALRPGAVLSLDRNRGDELPVLIEGVQKFQGVPVQDDGAIAIEITGRNR